ncbi:MAG TPA: aminotransferase class V-fold PLP-dependent enzyme, partial [Steroidobacteraceae bacterium]|nr:aminotransferase class V-fold PLP-dependent enzyme [Steroidobacteraceae bacterium]
AAMSRQPTDLGDPRVAQLIEACESGMKRLLQTERAEVFFYAANGHGGWEAVIANLVGPDTMVLVPGTGHFSDGWAEQIEAYGGRALRTPYVEGQPIDPVAVEAALRADREHQIGAVFAVHTDTASSTTSDIAAIRAAIDAARHPALYVVDVVASLAAAPFAMDALGVNVVMGASQKGLMVQPGLAFVAADERALAAAQRVTSPRFYWDWARRRSELPYRKFCGTLPMAHLAGLEAALGLIEAEGLANVHARHARLARAVQAAVGAWAAGGALRLFTKVPAARSVSVTAIEVSLGIDPEALRTVARDRFQVAVAGGLGPLAGRVFRIGHLGDINEPMVLGCLAGVEAAMQVQGVPHGRGGVEAAIASLAADNGR